ncbi:unnamed protein product, partial [Dovyalis caffra]
NSIYRDMSNLLNIFFRSKKVAIDIYLPCERESASIVSPTPIPTSSEPLQDFTSLSPSSNLGQLRLNDEKELAKSKIVISKDLSVSAHT